MDGVEWASGLLMSKLWTECPMVVVGLWYGQTIWRNRDTVTRSWGPLLCHSSAVITSCFSIIIMQGSVHNSWKINISQFFHGRHTFQTCHPLTMFGMLWIDVYESRIQFPPISSNLAQLLKRSGTGHNSKIHNQLYVKVSHCMRQMVVTPDADWFSDPCPYLFF
jgi:hypothetical protein